MDSGGQMTAAIGRSYRMNVATDTCSGST